MATSEQRSGKRIKFDRGRDCRIMAIDATWQRTCTLLDASDGGARLTITGSLQGLALKEFFLVLSPTGLAYRRCQLVWVSGEEIGVKFLRQATKGTSGKSKVA